VKRFIVIGLGNFGTGVAETLHGRGYEVVAVDRQERGRNRASASAELAETAGLTVHSIIGRKDVREIVTANAGSDLIREMGGAEEILKGL